MKALSLPCGLAARDVLTVWRRGSLRGARAGRTPPRLVTLGLPATPESTPQSGALEGFGGISARQPNRRQRGAAKVAEATAELGRARPG